MKKLAQKTAAAALAVIMAAGSFGAFAEGEKLRGDLNGDGEINITDLTKLAAHVKSIKGLEGEALAAGDINEDGEVNVTDMVSLAAYVKGIRELPGVKTVTMLPEEVSQVVNEEPATFESLSVDRDAKKSFEEEIAAKTDLPIINVTTNENSEMILSKEIYTSCVVDVFNCGEEFVMDEVSAGIRVRGNSSAYYGDVEQIKRNPVPYRIKFDKKKNMLGLNDGAECKSWVLLKSDWDLIRNDIALRFGRTLIGDNAYCSDTQFVHLYVNDKFQGIYVLCEQNQVNKNRVNITEPEKGYTGTDFGFYMELDNYAAKEEGNQYITMDYEGATVTDIRGETREFVPAEYSIKNDIYTLEQKIFINKYMNNVFKIIYEACENGTYYTFDENYDLIKAPYDNAEDTVKAVADVESIVDMYLLYDIVHDYDCGEGSFYMCVDFAEDSKVPKLQFTSPWDFNWAYNDSNTCYWAGAFCDKSFARRNGDRSNPWFIVLAKQDWFMDMAKDKWTAVQNRENGTIWDCVATERDILEKYADDLNKTDEWATGSANTLLEWIDGRLKWMDKTYLNQ
ncbi:CotH kinase family protein [Ruminococcus sp.]|uniref:CotH kinase family protein n=1 Tax=Ruminococcus sp. TaxID=41978 RepID=UPI0025EA2B8A|nr:CotH kinase family protein [Ruminococcus sp.]MBQ8965039.1 CotH kinase family protein [Ruminococcus sp.]